MPKSIRSPLLTAPRPRRDRRGPAGTRPPQGATADAFVIDDEVGICKYLAMALDDLGLTTQSLHSAGDAIAALERGKPEIVFLDIALGGSDAVDVIRALGETRYGGVVQLMSGEKSALLDDVHRIGALHGLNMCPPLQKPFRKEAVRQAVASVPLWDRPEVTISLAPAAEAGLDEAFANGWLELWYQPKIDLRTKAVTGADGLITCRHPVHGVRTIDGFLAHASTRRHTALAELSIVKAFADWEELARAGVRVRTAVSASFDALASVDLMALARQNRPRSQSWPGLILRISEHEVIKDINLAHEIATQLRIYDIELAIENFGAGFSSFERLRELPFSELRLHPGFVAGCARDGRNAGICRAAIELAHRFDIVAVADGLASEDDLRALRSMGCDAGLGPLFAEPMPKSQFIDALCERERTKQVWFA